MHFDLEHVQVITSVHGSVRLIGISANRLIADQLIDRNGSRRPSSSN